MAPQRNPAGGAFEFGGDHGPGGGAFLEDDHLGQSVGLSLCERWLVCQSGAMYWAWTGTRRSVTTEKS